MVSLSSQTQLRRRAPFKKPDFALNDIILGDCQELIKEMPKGLKFDLIIADPPYNVGKDFGNNKDQRDLTDYVSWSVSWIKLCLSRLKAGGLLYVYGFSEILSYIAVQFPLENQKWMVWHYTNKTIPSLKFWQRSHETIICFWKGKRPDLEIDQIREPYTLAYKKCIGKKRKATPSRFGSRETIYKGHKNGALPRDVLKISALAGGKGLIERSPLKHPTQKPLELLNRLLQASTKEGDLILDPFTGSSSTGIAARRLNRPFIGIDNNSQFLDLSIKRLQEDITPPELSP